MTTTPVQSLATILRTARHHGLGISALQVLLLLADSGDLPMSTIAARIGISGSAMTGSADTLTKKGLTRRMFPYDRRTVSLTLTEKGRERVYQLTGQQL